MVPAYSPLDDMETSPKEYRLCSWFPQDNLSFYGLSGNPSPAALALLRAEPDKIDWFALSGNPSEDAIEILATRPDKIYWPALSRNPSDAAVAFLYKRENQRKICWHEMSENANPDAAMYLKLRLERLNEVIDCYRNVPVETRDRSECAGNRIPLYGECGDWYLLSKDPRPEAVEILAANVDRIDWTGLALNPSPAVVPIMAANTDRLAGRWGMLRANPSPVVHKFWYDNYPVMKSWARGQDILIPQRYYEPEMPPVPIVEPAPLGVVESVRWYLDNLWFGDCANTLIQEALWRLLSSQPEIFEAAPASLPPPFAGGRSPTPHSSRLEAAPEGGSGGEPSAKRARLESAVGEEPL